MAHTISVNLKPLGERAQVKCLARAVIEVAGSAVSTAHYGTSASVGVVIESDDVCRVTLECAQ